LHVRLRDSRTVTERAQETLSIAAEYGIPFSGARATFVRGWALAVTRQGEEGIPQMRQAMSAVASGGARLSPYFAMLAEACGENGLREEGLAVVAEGLELAEQTDVRYCEAELHRLKGELLLMRHQSDSAEAERCFHTAIDIARRQAAKWWELRATTSL